MFRSGCGKGLWMATLLPLAMLNDPLILVALSTTIYSIFHSLDHKSQTKFNSAVVLTIMIALLSFSSLVSLIACLASFLAFVYALPKLFLTFQASFSYGEGVLVLQSIIVFSAKLFINLAQDVHNRSTVEGSYNIIANVGLGSIGLLCLLHYVPFRVFQHPSTFYLSGFTILFGITLPVLFSTLKRNPIGNVQLFSLLTTLGQKPTFYPEITMNLMLQKCEFCEK